MSFKGKLIRAKKAIIMGALAVAAVIPSVKGQTTEEETASDTATIVANETAKRKEMFESAVRAGAPREEIAKYIDFPEFIPVTKDGQFDKAKAAEWGKILTPYMKTLAEKGDKITTAEAYKAFKDATGQKNVSLEDFERVRKMAEKALGIQKYKIPGAAIESVFVLLFAGVTLAGAAGSMAFTFETIDGLHEFRRNRVPFKKQMAKTAGTLFMTAVAAAMAYTAGKPTARMGAETFDLLMEKPEQSVQKMYERMYNFHVNQTINDQQKQFKQVEFEGAMRQVKGVQK